MMSNISKSKKSDSRLQSFNCNDEFLSRISKTLYYSTRSASNCLSLPVTEFAAELFTEVRCGQTLERLNVEEASRISRNACVSPCSLVLAFLYLERLKDCNPEYLQRVAPSELFLVTLMIASKFLQDDGEEDEVFNAEWAKSGNLSLMRMNRLEKEFLRAIDWTIFVRDYDFWERLRKLEKDLSYKEGNKRGWFNYTELSCLLDSTYLTPVIQVFLRVSSVFLAAYIAGIATILGSIMVASYLPGSVFVPRKLSPSNETLVISYKPFTDYISRSNYTKKEIFLETKNISFIIVDNNFLYSRNFKDNDLINCLDWTIDDKPLSNSRLLKKSIENIYPDSQDGFDLSINIETNNNFLSENRDGLISILGQEGLISIDSDTFLQTWKLYVNYIL